MRRRRIVFYTTSASLPEVHFLYYLRGPPGPSLSHTTSVSLPGDPRYRILPPRASRARNNSTVKVLHPPRFSLSKLKTFPQPPTAQDWLDSSRKLSRKRAEINRSKATPLPWPVFRIDGIVNPPQNNGKLFGPAGV